MNISVDPKVAFGQPTIAGTGIPTDIVASRFMAGESVIELATDYELNVWDIEDAIRYHARTCCNRKAQTHINLLRDEWSHRP